MRQNTSFLLAPCIKYERKYFCYSSCAAQTIFPVIYEQDKQKGEGNMLTVLILIVYAIIGGVSTLAMVIGIPVVLGWKIYRKVKYQIPLMK